MKASLLFALLLLVLTGCQDAGVKNAAVNSGSNMNHSMSNMNHDMANMGNMSNMAGHDMMNMNSDPGAAQQPFDLQYLDSMIHHHNGAVEMAKMVLGKSERPELKAFAQKIIDDQTREIDEMKKMREQWYAGKPSSVNMEMPGMVGGMKIMNGEHMKDMAEMEPKHFDDHFLNMMLAHHEGAIVMSKDAQTKAEHPEIKQLADRIIKAQGPEIEQMKKWKSEWEKSDK